MKYIIAQSNPWQPYNNGNAFGHNKAPEPATIFYAIAFMLAIVLLKVRRKQ